jgi:hypothetical protein
MLQILFKAALEHAPELILTLITAILIPFAVRWILAHTSAKQQQVIAAAAEAAYLVVEQVSRLTPTKVDDKLALALRVMRDELKVVRNAKDAAAATVALKAVHESTKLGYVPRINGFGPR